MPTDGYSAGRSRPRIGGAARGGYSLISLAGLMALLSVLFAMAGSAWSSALAHDRLPDWQTALFLSGGGAVAGLVCGIIVAVAQRAGFLLGCLAAACGCLCGAYCGGMMSLGGSGPTSLGGASLLLLASLCMRVLAKR